MISLNKKWLGIILAVMCLSFILLAPGKVSAASISSHTSNVHPYTSGGGCAADGQFSSCISENSGHFILSNGYVDNRAGNYSCNTNVALYEDSTSNLIAGPVFDGCQNLGAFLNGPSRSAQAGHSYIAKVCGHNQEFNFNDCVWSPWQHA